MKAVLVRNGKSDKASDLYVGEYDVPELKPNEVLVRVKAFGLNRMDIMQRRGMYPLPPQAPKDILGVELSGVVTKVGPEAQDVNVDDEVFGLCYGGAYAEFVAVHHHMIVKKPTGLTHEQAAAIPEAWLTAFQALRYIGGLKAGQRVLMHAGASGVGLAVCQLARFYGAEGIFMTAGTSDKLAFVEKLGATKAINYKSESFREVILKQTNNEGVDVIIDPVGQTNIVDDIQLLRRDGRLVLLGFLSGSKLGDFDIGPVLFKRLRIEGTTLRSRSAEYQAGLLQDLMKDALKKFTQKSEEGGFQIVLHETYSVHDIIRATEDMENAKNIGKLVVRADW